MYKQVLHPITGQIDKVVCRISVNAFIPFDPANTDAQQFAKWLQEGNCPEPAEEGTVVTDEWIEEIIAKLLP